MSTNRGAGMKKLKNAPPPRVWVTFYPDGDPSGISRVKRHALQVGSVAGEEKHATVEYVLATKRQRS